MYNHRYFRLRYSPGFSDEMLKLIQSGYEEWQEMVRSTINQWQTDGISHAAPPEYVFGAINVDSDRTIVTIMIEGDPRSYDALKMFEDGVPVYLFDKLPIEVQKQVEMSYENPAVGIHPGRWLPADYRKT